MTKKISGDIINIWKIIKQNLLFLAVITLLGAGVSFAYSRFLVKPTYEVQTTFLLRSSQNISSEESENAATAANAELSSLTIFQKQMQTYLELAQQSVLKDQTDEALNLSSEDQSQVTSLAVTNTTDSQLITVTVRGTDYNLIKSYVSTFSQSFKNFSAEKFGADNLQLVSDATGDQSPVAPSLLKNTVIGAVLCLFVATNFVIMRHIRRDLIENEEEIEAILGVPIIGAIPNTESGKSLNKRKTR